MVFKQRAFFLLAGMALGVSLTSASASAADMDSMVTKAPPYAVLVSGCRRAANL